MIQASMGSRPRGAKRETAAVRARSARRRKALQRRSSLEALEGRIVMASSAQLSVGPLVNISRFPLGESEPAIAIDPSNPSRLFAAAIGGPTFDGQLGSFSTDGGVTWNTRVMSNGSDNTPLACCDATLSFDTFGNLFFGYLDSNIDTVVLISTDGGQSFSLLANLGDSDQPTVVTGPGSTPGTQSVWVTYNRNGQIFARGALVSGLGQVGAFNTEQPTGEVGNYGDIAIGPNGEVFVSYQENSGGQGPTFVSGNLDPDGLGPAGFGAKVRISATNVGGFDYIPPQPDRSVDAEVGLAWDRSNGPNRGRLYAMYTDEAPNESDDTDIYLRYSDDRGLTWSNRLRVNDDTTTRSQFLPKIALDQTSGTIAITWLDSRLDDGSNPLGDTDGRPNTDAILFATVSTDGGLSVVPNVQIGRGPSNQAPVQHIVDIDYGDYLGLAFHAGKFYPIWPDNSAQMPGISDRPNFDLATAQVSVIQLLVTPTPINGAEENKPLVDIEVARFDSFDPTDQPGDFTATIDWGDGNSSTGVITKIAGSRFRVIASHTYADGGDYGMLITIAQSGGGTASGAQTVSVANKPLEATPVRVPSQVGTFLSEGSVFQGVIATFRDLDLDPQTADFYTATILWGDDGSTSLGSIHPLGNNEFEVVATHVVGGTEDLVNGTPVNVTIVGPGGVTTTVTSRMFVSDSELESVGIPFSPTEGTTHGDLAVAFFIDGDPRKPPSSNYTASINWGDNSPLEPGVIRPGVYEINGQLENGFFVYSAGSHVYNTPPVNYNVSIRIDNTTGPNFTVAGASATVANAAIIATPISYSLTGPEFDNFLATFVDTDPRSHPVTRYTAKIDWNTSDTDLTTEDVQVVVNTDGGFLVRGKHGYRLSGRYGYSLSIFELGSATPAETVAGTIEVPPASVDLVVQAPTSPVEGQEFDGTIATFTTSNTFSQEGDFQATISWGDGSTTQNAQLVMTAPGVFEVKGDDKTYLLADSYTVIVTVVGDGSTLSGQAIIVVTDAPLIASGVNLPSAGQPPLLSKTDLFGLLVATFTDTGSVSILSDFSATVDWGDGTTGPAFIEATSTAGEYRVLADHRFARSGNLTPTVTISSRPGGRPGYIATTTLLAVVEPKLTTLTGGLDSSAGPGASQGATQLARPSFRGTAEPGAVVTLLIQSGQGQEVVAGTGVADATGVWIATLTQDLAPGTYNVQASAIDALGSPSSAKTPLLPGGGSGPLVIDRTGPRVSRVIVDAGTGRIAVTLTDDGSGLLRSALENSQNYGLAIVGRRFNRALRLTGLTLGDPQPGTVQTATLTFGSPGRLTRGTYAFRMTAPGLTDLAGNVLDERFYVPFPGVYARPGQDFVAEFSTDGRVSTPLRQFVPPPERTAARRFQEKIRRLRTPRV